MFLRKFTSNNICSFTDTGVGDMWIILEIRWTRKANNNNWIQYETIHIFANVRSFSAITRGFVYIKDLKQNYAVTKDNIQSWRMCKTGDVTGDCYRIETSGCLFWTW
jgi:hypothetical protein